MIARRSVAVALLTASLVTPAGFAEAQSVPSRGRPETTLASAGEVSRARGVIKSVTAGRLVLEASNGATDTVFALDDKTVVQRLGKSITARDLKAGDPVTVSYTREGGKVLATRVWLRSDRGEGGKPAAPGGAPVSKSR